MKTKLPLFMVVALFGVFLVTARADTPPEIIDPPLTQFAWVGQPVTFKVSFTNTTLMNFQWQWKGDDILNATNETLRLNAAALTNDGDYRVVLSNSAGVVTSAVAHVTVRDWPQPTGASFTNLSALETNLENLLRVHAIPGASLAIMKDGRLLLARGYGYADPETGEQVQPDSLFRIASLTKAITATAILKLVDEGRLNLDDPVFAMLNLPPPTFPGAQPDVRLTNITVRHLLNHTAGWNRDTARNPNGTISFDPVYWPQRCQADLGITNQLTTRDFVWWLSGFPLQTSPGTAWKYSNNGYIIAGLLIETITGRSYAEAVRALLAPADITRLRVPGRTRAERRPDEVVEVLSPLIDVRSDGGNRYEFPSSITPELAYLYSPETSVGANGWETSAMDYARFITTIDGLATPVDFISTNAEKTMLTVSPASRAEGDPYGMGWFIDEATGEISHDGFLRYGTQAIAVRRRDGTTYVVLCNSTDFDLYSALKSVLDTGVSAIKAWPTNDLFPATMSYEAWQARHFTPDELIQPTISGDDADPDGDGISNLLEYAQASDPRFADHEPWLRARLISNGGQPQLRIEHRRRPLGHAVGYAVEVSSDLITWQPFNGTTIEQIEADGMLKVSLLDSTAAGLTSQFYRVSAKPLR